MTTSMNPSASKFIKSEGAKLARSHTRLYLALILDVIQNHKGTAPRGYPAAVAEAVPELGSMVSKYCTIISPAIASAHLEVLCAFPATASGLDEAVQWFSNQSRLAGYTLSLEDSVRFFKGKWSVKAQKEQEAHAASLIANKRVADAVEETSRKQEADDASNKRGKAIQTKLADIVQLHDNKTGPAKPLEQGPIVGEEKDTPTGDNTIVTNVVTIQHNTLADTITITGLDSMDFHALNKLVCEAQIALEAKMGQAGLSLKQA